VIGVVIPALNEAQTLPALLADLRRVPVPLDVVVADGGSTDGTLAAAAAAGARGIAASRGRATQMNPPLARRVLLAAVVDVPDLEAAVFRFAIDLPRAWRRFIELGQTLRQALYGLPYGDQGLLVRRALFEGVGGFPELPLLEDVALLRALRRHTRVRTLPAALVTSGRRYRRDGVVRTWLKHTGIIFLYFAGVSPGRLARWRDG